MKKAIKFLLALILLGALAVGSYIYAGLKGIPWKHGEATEKLTHHVENKYDIKVDKVKNYFNFKDGWYGVTFKTDEGIEFNAEINFNRNDKKVDFYPEQAWRKELRELVVNDIQNIFDNERKIYVGGIYGISHEMNLGKEIPSFKEVNHPFYIRIHLEEEWNEERKEQYMNKLLDVVKLLQRNNVENTEITLHFEELENADKTISFYFLTIPYNEVPDIENVQDIERYIERSFRR